MSDSAAHNLLGHTLEGGWEVIEKLDKDSYKDGTLKTGGTFSVCYIVRNKKIAKDAFLKALDYDQALKSPDIPLAFQAMTNAFIFERDLLYKCRNHRLSNVVKPITHGSLILPVLVGVPNVSYIILEKADSDLREWTSHRDSMEISLRLRVIHQIAKGIKQLHSRSIAHQDIKPSNSMIFARAEAKIGDLGCCSVKGESCPRDGLEFAGDPRYTPPELLYGYVDPQWEVRRFGCDMYQLGCLTIYILTFYDLNTLIRTNLPPKSRWGKDQYIVYPIVIDELVHAWELALMDVKKAINQFTPHLAEELVSVIEQLTHPSPDLRGDPLNRRFNMNPFDFERYISRFDRLSRRALFLKG